MDPDVLNQNGNERMMREAMTEFEATANKGNPHARSVMAFLFGMGMMRERNKAKAFIYQHFAAEAGNIQSKMALVYTYLRQDEKEYFGKAADNEEASGHYDLKVMYLKGIGVKRDVKLACKYFLVVANAAHQKAFYQLAKMFHTGVGLKQNLQMVNLVLLGTICTIVVNAIMANLVLLWLSSHHDYVISLCFLSIETICTFVVNAVVFNLITRWLILTKEYIVKVDLTQIKCASSKLYNCKRYF